MNGVSKKFRRMAELYRFFSKDWHHVLDVSDYALLNLYNHESYGTPLSSKNGFAVGKSYLNVHVAMWKEDIEAGILCKYELYEDPNLPHWWLDSVLK